MIHMFWFFADNYRDLVQAYPAFPTSCTDKLQLILGKIMKNYLCKMTLCLSWDTNVQQDISNNYKIYNASPYLIRWAESRLFRQRILPGVTVKSGLLDTYIYTVCMLHMNISTRRHMFAVYWSCQSEINLWQCPRKCAIIRHSLFESYCIQHSFWI
jgi:hypothetical protein